jgi:nucleoside-diphosphate-sugar epimerase
MSETVFITGVSGFLGSALAEHLNNQGYRIFGSSTRVELSTLKSRAERVVKIRLGELVDPECFRDVDVLIHCAHSAKLGDAETNIKGTEDLARAAEAQGVQFQLYVSSYTALSQMEGSTTEYGRVKSSLEEFFRKRGAAIVRPGLILGSGGLFRRIETILDRFTIVPLLGGGKSPVSVVSIKDVCKSVEILIRDRRVGEFNLFILPRPSLKEFMFAIRNRAQHRSLFIPIPFWCIEGPLLIADKLGLKLPITIENIRGYKNNGAAEAPSHLSQFIDREPSLEKSLESALSC